ncbi:hypothetical protein ACWNYI_00445 [Candidatus Vidania fulgoroideorum]
MSFLSFKDFEYIEYLKIFKICLLLKKKNYSLNKNVLIKFDLPSTRTNISFKIACQKLGCNLYEFDKKKSQLIRGEKKKDTYKVFEGYFDMIIFRGISNKLKYLSRYFKGIIINALTEKEHPTQILNDIFTIFEIKKNFDFTILWVGELNNVSKSLIYASKKFGFLIKFLTDKKSKKKIKKINIIRNIKEIKKIDFIMTDTWNSMNNKKKDKKKLKVKYKFFKINKKAYFMHCLPLYRDKEVEKKVLKIKNNIIWKQSQNKIITSMALIKYIFK